MNVFKIGEEVMVKRTSGKWEKGTVLATNGDGSMVVKVIVTDNFRG